jgi:hypothetical protein
VKQTSNKFILAVSAIVLGHAAVVAWHLFLVSRIVSNLSPSVIIAPTIGILISIIGLIFLWLRKYQLAAVFILITMMVGLYEGITEHFINRGPFNIFDVSSPEWAFSFNITVFLLVILELAGLWAGVRAWLLRDKKRLNLQTRVDK